jgi:ribosomal protein L37AE/L43A
MLLERTSFPFLANGEAIRENTLVIYGASAPDRKSQTRSTRTLWKCTHTHIHTYLTYKAVLAGVKLIKVFERLTSQICYRCGEGAEQKKCTGLFICHKCGRENADRNAVFNIAYRALYVISVVERTLIEMLSLILLTGL